MLSIVCVLKSGGDYGPEHAHALMRTLWDRGHDPRICFTDEDISEAFCTTAGLMYDLPGWWSKMEVFNVEALRGDILYIDLDTIVTGDLTDILAACAGHQPILLEDFLRPGGLQSSLMYFPEEARRSTWDRFVIQSDAVMGRFARGGDQQFLETIWLQYAKRWQDIVPGQIVSYKKDCAAGVPDDARMVIFHGLPRPWDTELWHG